MSSRLVEYARLMRLDRPIGLWLLLWPALWALWLSGDGRPDERVFAIFVAGTFLTRAAGCVINDYADRKVDPQVRRTARRPLAQSTVSPAAALGLFALLSAAALALLIPLGRLTQQLALIGGALTVIYPFLKRFFPLPQAWLGAAFAWSVPMAFAEQTAAVPAVAWLLFAAVVFWTTAYDTMYAMVDREDDLKLGVRSSAILFGRADRVAVAILQVATLASLVAVGWMIGLGRWYWLGLLTAAALAVWQQWLIRDREPAACFQAFLNNNYFGMAVFVGLALHYHFR
jgi:4-hydroxybenzoate polyprenyltransferase